MGEMKVDRRIQLLLFLVVEGKGESKVLSLLSVNRTGFAGSVNPMSSDAATSGGNASGR